MRSDKQQKDARVNPWHKPGCHRSRPERRRARCELPNFLIRLVGRKNVNHFLDSGQLPHHHD
jgi:hypothetical protein